MKIIGGLGLRLPTGPIISTDFTSRYFPNQPNYCIFRLGYDKKFFYPGGPIMLVDLGCSPVALQL